LSHSLAMSSIVGIAWRWESDVADGVAANVVVAPTKQTTSTVRLIDPAGLKDDTLYSLPVRHGFIKARTTFARPVPLLMSL
jgi:hypothetical protein